MAFFSKLFSKKEDKSATETGTPDSQDENTGRASENAGAALPQAEKDDSEDPLATALQRAREHPEAREVFYDCLLQSEVLVRVAEDDINRFMPLEDGTLPIFSCKERFSDGGSPDWVPTHIRIPVKKLFAAFPDTSFYLNPFAEYNKYFSAEEVAWLMEEPAEQSRPVRPDEITASLIGIPAEMPEALLEYLREHFRTCPAVSRAYLSLAYTEGADTQEFHYLVSLVLDMDKQVESLSSAGIIPTGLARVIDAGSYVDFRDILPEKFDEKQGFLFYERQG